jgi:mRNA interferase RelE/StbE
MSHQILIVEQALDELGRLSREDYKLITAAIRDLSREPYRIGGLRLVGYDGWHRRVGNYRLVYEVDDEQQTITVLHVGRHRNAGR